MQVAVIGGGGREHAIIKKLGESPRVTRLFAIPGNGGMAALARCVPLVATDLAGVADWCVQNRVDYVVVAPDDPLALGMVDVLAARGIPAFGPTQSAARIEASKAFAKDLMQRCGIPTAAYGTFTEAAPALAWMTARGEWPVVVKADGLALGKGVVICQNVAEARATLEEMLSGGRFGQAGRRVVVEQFLTGPEVSVLAFCDGRRVVPMVSSMDHKRALDGDNGPNTGGMGAVAPNPFYTPEVAARCMEEIFLPTLRGMAQAGAPFRGCLYFGLMLTPQGPMVIEYNCRFGDPETQVVLPLLQGDLLEIMLACTEGRLDTVDIRFSPDAAACVVMAGGGYPGPCQTGLPIRELPQAERLVGVTVYHAGTRLQGGQVVTAGGRVLNVCATAPGLGQALDLAYAAAGQIRFEDAHYRRDIGRAALAAGGD